LPTPSDYAKIPLNIIREPSHRLRENIAPEALGELADSMAAEGLHQPVGLRGPLSDGTWEIIYGHRRLLAAQLLNWKEIPAMTHPADFDPLLAAVSENLNREQMTPVEEAKAIARFVERGEPDAAIARMFRRSAPWVAARRALLLMPEDLQNAVHERTIKLGVAEALADIDHDSYRRSLIAEAQRTGATAVTAQVWRQHYLTERERIVSNHMMVEEITSRREAWKIVVACDLCRADFEYQDTRALRVCVDCKNVLAAAAAEEAQAAAAAARQ
jgi:ParB family chromosome partitioning protein